MSLQKGIGRGVLILTSGLVAATQVNAQTATSFEVYGFAQADYVQDFNRVNPAWDDTLRPSKIPTIKGLFGGGPFSFAGKHYTITEMDGQPKPIQRPHPPFFIGGGGRRILSIAGREADIVSLAPRLLSGQRGDPLSITWAGTEEKIGWVREAAGQRFGDLEFNVYPTQWPIVVTNDLRGEARKVIDKMKSRTGVELTEDEVIAAPNIFIGSIDRFVEKFQELRERLGISSFMVGEIDELAPVVERLAGT